MGVLDCYDSGHDFKKRKIINNEDGHYDYVYVFREFASDDDDTQVAPSCDNTQLSFDTLAQSSPKKRPVSSSIAKLLSDDDDDDDELGGDLSA